MEQGLPSLPNGWHKKQLGDVVKLSQGTQVPVGDQYLEQEDGLIRFLRISDFVRSDEPPRYILNPGSQYLVEADDICMIRYGDAGRAVTGLTGALANNLFKISPIESLLKRFLFLQLCSPRCVDYLRAANNSSTMPAISFKAVNAMEVSVAPLDEQKRIVEKLDALLTRIDTAIEHLQESVVLADALYASELNEIFNPSSSPINQIGIYELPDRWEWKQLSDVVDKTENLNPLKNADQLWTYIDISSVDRARFTITDPKKFLGKDAPSRAKKHVQLNDVIFATTRPNLKNIALVRDEYNSPVASTGFCVLRANEKVLPAYLFYFVTTDFIQAQIEPYVGGASYPAITDGNLKKAPIPIPSIEEQKSIVKKINNIEKLQVALKEQLQLKISSLEQLKASILDSAFKGEL